LYYLPITISPHYYLVTKSHTNMNSFGLNQQNLPKTATPLNYLILSPKLHTPNKPKY